MLKVEGLNVYYGNVRALTDVSFEVNRGEIVTLIGANGAGKSTVMRTISGIVKPESGTIELNGKSLVELPPYEVVRLGLAHAPEGRRIIPGLTVYENLEIATTPWRRRSKSIAADLDRVYARFPKLKERHKQQGWSLSGGEQQMLSLGRALMARPSILLLDEPSLGLAPMIVDEVFKAIEEVNRDGVTILLVEQNAYMALEVSARAYVLENGRIVMANTSAKLLEDDAVRKAYLGA